MEESNEINETNENNQTNEEVKKCVTAVIYDDMGKPFFLILKRQRDWEGWEFVKGGMEPGESEEDAVKREILEETGLQKFKILKKMEGITKEFKGTEGKLNVHAVYLVEASMNIPINIPTGHDPEHSTYLWADAESVGSKLTWENDQLILAKVLEELKN
jgi:8-oxo-dGTP pyrophosphatase MutT (NUDIX family)|tara:strand:- start:93 stop:569 length:477 start_codon:yes stop_codon:yes gene_type:complete